MKGIGHAPCHHGEILQGVFADAAGNLCRGLVTLPLVGPGARAEFHRDRSADPGDLTVVPGDRAKARRAAELAVAECARVTGQRPCGGVLDLSGDIPIGLGMGSSTSDIIATVRAVAASFGIVLRSSAIARLAVRAELASDPLMLDNRPLLFAQREGRVLEVLGGALPAAVIVGCATGGGQAVDTLAIPVTEYGPEDLGTFERLRAMLRRAIGTGDVELLGRVSTESARINQRVLPKAEFEVLEHVAALVGGAGVQVAHSGNVAGVLFDAGSPDLPHRLRRCTRVLRQHGIEVTRVFGSRNWEEREHARPHRGCDRAARSGARRAWPDLPAFRNDEDRVGARRRAAAAGGGHRQAG
ncbi:GHMP kinase [Amycolatopsis anabasis]|uniref:GHMP family kinase ATP-binding protein n=1 Tax=Amycolatopsis anabasis TaxID=1840409 RepID=UPI001FEAAAA7|nr:GHMP kinase [Amycolatopsis anabasis]